MKIKTKNIFAKNFNCHGHIYNTNTIFLLFLFRPYFYLNLILYVGFMVFLTAYCLLLSSYLDTRGQQHQQEGEEGSGLPDQLAGRRDKALVFLTNQQVGGTRLWPS
jgi:hypothetical protein